MRKRRSFGGKRPSQASRWTMFSDRDDKRNVELKGWRVGFQGLAPRCAGAAAGQGTWGTWKVAPSCRTPCSPARDGGAAWWSSGGVSADLRPWVSAHCSQQRRAPQRKQRRRREVRYIQCTRGTACVQTGKTGGVHGCPDEKLQPADGSAGAVDDDDSSPVVSWAQRIPSPEERLLFDKGSFR